jgi:hypothetical protein
MRNNGLVRTIGGCQGGQWENSTKSSQPQKELNIAAAANDDITFQVALHPSVYIAQFIF